MTILFEFLMRLACGMAFAMVLTSARQVSSGFFRNHLYVVLGVLTLGCLAAASIRRELFWGTVAAAALAYAGGVAWLYDAKRTGKSILLLVAATSLCLAITSSRAASPKADGLDAVATALDVLDVTTASWLVGTVMVSMLLGHWYLNAPEMEIQPLDKLLGFAFAGLVARAAVCGGALFWGVRSVSDFPQTMTWLIVLRWACGLAGLAAALWMARQTLKIPNTQSATGLLYVAVFAVLSGEIASLLMSGQNPFVL
jgi:hypothetical protein